jgi:hypothetical protein
MSKKVLMVCAVMVMTGSMMGFAGDSGSGTGYFTNHFQDVSMTEMPDGSAVQLIHYSNLSVADDADNPSADTAGECVGTLRMNATGVVTSGSGACFVKAADGHGFSYWWEVEESGTADCPALCGTWSYYGGFGRFDGLEGKGDWEVTSQFGETGSMGTWTNTYSMP